MKRSVVKVFFSEKTKDMTAFQTNFSKHFPECEAYPPPSGLPNLLGTGLINQATFL